MVKISDELQQRLMMDPKSNSDPMDLSVDLDTINSFGNDESIRRMFGNIASYNRMLKERITFINEDITRAIPFTRENLYLITAFTGNGKCFKKGTKVLMYDGSIKAVEDVIVGDQVMGSDSTPRTVLSLGRGHQMMYDVVPTKGETYTVNADHILTLVYNGGNHIYKNLKKGQIVNLSVQDYLQTIHKHTYLRNSLKGYRSKGIDFMEQAVPLDPYVIGAWLGDGASEKPQICSADSEIIDYLIDFAKKNELAVLLRKSDINKPLTTIDFSSISRDVWNKTNSKHKNIFRDVLKKLNLFNNKHIPDIYKFNSKNIRLQILAGLIDTDGGGDKGCIDICFKVKSLAEDTVFIARSLGLAAYMHPVQKMCCNSKTKKVGTYYRISISGDLSIIPTKLPRKQYLPRKQIKDVTHVGIQVRPTTVQDYYGFEVDGDHLFLLADFTVVHNSSCAANISYPLWKEGKKSLIITNEESEQDVLFRIACLELGLNFNEYKKGHMPIEDQKKVVVLFPEISKYIKIIDVNYKEGLTTKLEGIQNALTAVQNADYSCALIDYYQLIKFSVNNKANKSYDVLNDLRIWLGRYIKNSNIPVVLFAQLHSLGKRGKDIDSRIKDCPGVSEAATVILEMVPNFDNKTTDFILCKDRFGLTGRKITCGFDKGRFVPMTHSFEQSIFQDKLDDITGKKDENV